jgi:hypothetical protein
MKMTKVKCQKCGNEGYLIVKQTVSKGIRYQYSYVKHNVDNKIKWCYIGKTLPAEYQKLKPVRESTQTGTQKSTQTQNPDSSSISENIAGGVGFEPTTTNLGGWCSIRAELR